MNTRSAYDLTNLCSTLKKTEDVRFRNFIRYVEQYYSANSILYDLLRSEDAIIAAHELQNSPERREVVVGALGNHAILTYARATVSRMNARRRVDVTKAFTPELMLMHKAIADLRDTVIAHHNKGEGEHGNGWREEKVILRLSKGICSTTDVGRSYNFKGKSLMDLQRLLNAAIPFVTDEILLKQNEMNLELTRLVNDEPEFSELLKQHQFYPEEFYASTAGSEAFWDNEPSSHETFRPPNSI